MRRGVIAVGNGRLDGRVGGVDIVEAIHGKGGCPEGGDAEENKQETKKTAGKKNQEGHERFLR
jgi:hypothetical protein